MTQRPIDRSVDVSAWAELEHYEFGYLHTGSQLKDHIYERSRQCFARGDRERDALRTCDDVRRRQEKLREFFLDRLGGIPKSDTPLEARVNGVVHGNGFSIEKIIFESRPRHYVTANLYLPADRQGPGGAVLFLCGHTRPAKLDPDYQIVCQALVQAGLVVLAMDPLGQGERLGYFEPPAGRISVEWGTEEHDHAGAQCRLIGDSIARYFLHDAMRGIDYLLTRPEVDAGRIGVTGNSGGGTQTSLLMLADRRIAAAAPGTFITSRDHYQRTGQPQDSEQIWVGFTGVGYDHEDILLAMAPKPVCVLAVKSDFFPIEGTRHTVARARRAWELFGKSDALKLVEDAATHAYTATLAQASAEFFARHLLDRDLDARALPIATPFGPEVLQCTRSGQVRGELPEAKFVFEANLERYQQIETQQHRELLPARREKAVTWLREQVFRDRRPCDTQPRLVERARRIGELAVDVAFWWTQPHLANLGYIFRPHNWAGSLPVTVAIWDEGTCALAAHGSWIEEQCASGRAVFVVSLCGMGPLRPDTINTWPQDGFFGTLQKLSDDLTWLDDSLVALRTYELLRAIDVIAEWPGLSSDAIELHGAGRMGVHGRIAAALDKRIKRFAWVDAFAYRDFVRDRLYDSAGVKPILLTGVLRYLDVDEL